MYARVDSHVAESSIPAKFLRRVGFSFSLVSYGLSLLVPFSETNETEARPHLTPRTLQCVTFTYAFLICFNDIT